MSRSHGDLRVYVFDPRRPGRFLAPKLAQVVREALGYLDEKGQMGASTKEVAKAVRKPRRTVQRALHFLLDTGHVEEQGRGNWVTIHTVPDELAKLNARTVLHGLHLVGHNWPLSSPGTPGSASESAEVKVPLGNFGEWTNEGPYLQVTDEWAGRRVEFRWQPTPQTLQVYVQASRLPIGLVEGLLLYGWLQGRCHPLDPGEHLDVSQVSVNKDYPSLRLDGLNSFRFRKFLNAWFSGYNKEGVGLRIEGEMSPRELSFSQMLEIISTFDPVVVEARATEALAKAIQKLAEVVAKVSNSHAKEMERMQDARGVDRDGA